MPIFRLISTMARTEVFPRRCPSIRFLPRSFAHRPLPSIMMATCRGSRDLSKPCSSIDACSHVHRIGVRSGVEGVEEGKTRSIAAARELNRHDLFFFGLDDLVDSADEVISDF